MSRRSDFEDELGREIMRFRDKLEGRTNTPPTEIRQPGRITRESQFQSTLMPPQRRTIPGLPPSQNPLCADIYDGLIPVSQNLTCVFSGMTSCPYFSTDPMKAPPPGSFPDFNGSYKVPISPENNTNPQFCSWLGQDLPGPNKFTVTIQVVAGFTQVSQPNPPIPAWISAYMFVFGVVGDGADAVDEYGYIFSFNFNLGGGGLGGFSTQTNPTQPIFGVGLPNMNVSCFSEGGNAAEGTGGTLTILPG